MGVLEKLNQVLFDAMYRQPEEEFESRVSTWRNVPGTKFIWYGEHYGAEVEYKDHCFHCDDLEDLLWDRFIEEVANGTEENFENWVSVEECISALYSLMNEKENKHE